jgi:hypothetical protein
MTRYDHLPIWKGATRLAVVLEEAVRRFPRYRKYTLGAVLRRPPYTVCHGVVVANAEREGRAGRPYVVAAEDCYLKHGLKCVAYCTKSAGWPRPPPKIRTTPASGARHAS